MFLHVSVILFTGGACVHTPPAMHTPLPCMPPAMHAPCHAPLPHMPPAMHAPCHTLPPTMHGPLPCKPPAMPPLPHTPPPTTHAPPPTRCSQWTDGTHPTWMHSCLVLHLLSISTKLRHLVVKWTKFQLHQANLYYIRIKFFPVLVFCIVILLYWTEFLRNIDWLCTVFYCKCLIKANSFFLTKLVIDLV